MSYLIVIIGFFLWVGYISNSNKEKALKQQVIDRDKRNQWQYNDLKAKEKYKSLWIAALATFIVAVLFSIFGCSSKCDTPSESLEQRFSVTTCNGVDSVRIDTTYKTFDSVCDCEEYCKQIKQAVELSIAKSDSIHKQYLLLYGQRCNCK